MNETELAELESAINVKLPEEYRQWALRCSTDEGLASKYWFRIDAWWIIWRNKSLRQDGWWRGEEWKLNLLCIGVHEMGDAFIDVNDLSKGVYFAYCDGDGEPYDPEDYSACWWMPFEQFARGEVD